MVVGVVCLRTCIHVCVCVCVCVCVLAPAFKRNEESICLDFSSAPVMTVIHLSCTIQLRANQTVKIL